MRRVTDFRTCEIRIPSDRFPLPERVQDLLRVYGGLGRWEGPPHSPGSVAVFELPTAGCNVDDLSGIMEA